MTRCVIDPAVRRAIQADFPQRDVEAIHARFAKWSETREVYAPERAFRTWVENAERDNAHRLDAGGRPATAMELPVLGERSDPDYVAFRLALIDRILSDRLSPAGVLEILDEYYSKLSLAPGLKELLDYEMDYLMAMGDEWKLPEDRNAERHAWKQYESRQAPDKITAPTEPR